MTKGDRIAKANTGIDFVGVELRLAATPGNELRRQFFGAEERKRGASGLVSFAHARDNRRLHRTLR